MLMPYLQDGDTIGVASPSRVVDKGEVEELARFFSGSEFKLRIPEHLLDVQWGYCASAEDRAADLNQLIHDPRVKLVLFGGGESSSEVLPYIDYASIIKRPKLFCSFSDGTTILHAIHSQCGIPVFYGPTPGSLLEGDDYTYAQFDRLKDGQKNHVYKESSPWLTLREGVAEGTLVAGYLRNFCLLFSNPYVRMEQGPVVLFLEDHEQFTEIGGVAGYLANLAMQPFARQVRGLVFGHYSDSPDQSLFDVLVRFGEKFDIPVWYTDDFGHGAHHAVLPIGRRVKVGGKRHIIKWLEEV